MARMSALFTLFLHLVTTGAEIVELSTKGDIIREPSDGNLEFSEDSRTLQCTLNGNAEVVSDTRWYRMADDEEKLIEGQSLKELDVTELVGDDWADSTFKVRCRIGTDHMSEFNVHVSNFTLRRSPFKVKKFKKSYEIDVQQDRQFTCVIINRSMPLEDVMKDVKVKWFKWNEINDLSFRPKKDEVKKKPNCSSVEAMLGSGWVEIKGTEIEEGEMEPHLQVFKGTIMKLEDARYSDRRGYKCVAYNASEPEKCSESTFFIRVKDKYAAWWPFLGIVAEVVVLCFVIFLCERRKGIKCPDEEEEQNGGTIGVQAGSNSSSSVRQRHS